MWAPMNPLLKALVDGAPNLGLPSESANAPPARAPIVKLRYSHEAMIEILIAEPWISQNELADRFGMSASWISIVLNSDLFQSKLHEKRESVIDPELRASLKVQFQGLLGRSIEILRHKLDGPPDKISDQLALQTAKVAAQSLGMGVRETKIINHNEVHAHLEELGGNLVGLLRRRKVEALSDAAGGGRIIDGEVSTPPRS